MSQVDQVLEILKRDGGITRLVGLHYEIKNLPDSIHQLRKRGWNIKTVTRKDAVGREYTRWTLAATKEQPLDKQLELKLAA